MEFLSEFSAAVFARATKLQQSHHPEKASGLLFVGGELLAPGVFDDAAVRKASNAAIPAIREEVQEEVTRIINKLKPPAPSSRYSPL